MSFEGDAFISYAHLDDREFIEGHKGWVTNLHRALEVRVAEKLGKEPQIWRDRKLTGNDHFSKTLLERLVHVASLIAIVSPRYVKSEWALKELNAFTQAAETHGGLCIQDKLRIFKVLKTPVPIEEHPPELQAVLGYEFFKTDPVTGITRELNKAFGPDMEIAFCLKLDDLAHDICELLKTLEHPEASPNKQRGPGVYLAETTSDLHERRLALRRNLQDHGYQVYPVRPLPCVASELRVAVAEDLKKCKMSVMLVGRDYGIVPEGCKESQLDIQNQLSIERGKKGDFSRLLWMAPGTHAEDERQIQFIDRLRLDPGMTEGADLLETDFEHLQTEVFDKLKRPPVPAPHAAPIAQNPALKTNLAPYRSLYFIQDQRDSEAASAWIGPLFDHFEVLPSVFEGDEAEIREYHDENLRNCDGVLIFYGTTNELWVRRKLREVQKAPGYGRTKPAPVVGIVLAPPRNPEKEHFRTHDAIVIPQLDGLAPDSLQQFIDSLKG